MHRSGVLSLALIACLFTGCDTRSRTASARLRTENADLKRQIDSLTLQTAELQAKLQASMHDEDPQPLLHSPRLAHILISPITGYETKNGTAVLEVHVTAHDGRNRPIQLVGPLEAQVLRPREGLAPELVASIQLEPDAVRDAWRGGLMGATYLVQLPIPPSASETPLLVHVFHEDLVTGRRLECSGSVSHKPSTDDV